MDELDRLLAETMQDAAGRAPSDDNLLSTVHDRSRRLHRRRVVTGLSAVAAVVAVGIPFVSVLATRPEPALPPAATAPVATRPTPGPSATATPTASRSAPPSRPPSSPAAPPSGDPASTAVTLTEGWTAPVFPYTLPNLDNRREPVASVDDGDLIGFFETTDPEHEADITVTVSGTRPSFSTDATETARQVRGAAGTLRTGTEQPAARLTLFWPETPSRWITLTTDDTYTADEVVAWADGLAEASIAVLPPFRLSLSPTGMATETVSKSRMIFGAPGTGGISLVLRQRQEDLTGANQTINGYDARLEGTTVTVDVADWDATLEITVGTGLTISDADLLRLAAGVRLETRSNPE